MQHWHASSVPQTEKKANFEEEAGQEESTDGFCKGSSAGCEHRKRWLITLKKYQEWIISASEVVI